MNQFWLWNVSATTRYDMNQKVTPLVEWLSFPIGKKKKNYIEKLELLFILNSVFSG